MRLTRRSLVRTGVLTALSPILGSVGVPFVGSAARAQVPSPAGNVGRDWKHGLSLFGELKYPPGFKHFDYVNPRAPKGGAVRMVAFGTFDNFNEVVSGLKGSIAMGVGMTSDTLTVSSLDEVSTDYGLHCRIGQPCAGLCVGELSLAHQRRAFTTASRSRSTT